MPTGYTADIKNGIDFKTFVLNCARAFGACVEIRDEPGGGERIPDEFKPSNYHLNAANDSKNEFLVLKNMSPDEIECKATAEYEKAEKYRMDKLKEIKELRLIYGAMLYRVQDWEPPTPEHIRLREFMLEQIETSIDFDCDIRYLTPH